MDKSLFEQNEGCIKNLHKGGEVIIPDMKSSLRYE